MLTLHCGTARCDLYPEIGGSLGCWSIDGQDMLRRASTKAIAAGDPLGMASFPLIPYSNRIGHARFDWNNETIHLRPNFPPRPHAIHGVGWRRNWAVTAHAADTVTLALAHDGDEDWPWPFEAEQHLTLTDRQLTLRLTARNCSTLPVPLAFGHHPYFDADGASLQFAAQSVWLNGDDALPTHSLHPEGDFDFSVEHPLASRRIDHCYDGITGRSGIAWAERRLALTMECSSTLPAAVVYIPGGPAFCYEPVPHINNALNLSTAASSMPIVAPGECFEAHIAFRAIDH